MPRRPFRALHAPLAAVALVGLAAAVQVGPASGAGALGRTPARPVALSDGRIKHVVVIYQENHTFDETLGAYCATRATPCDGYVGPVRLRDTNTVNMTQSPDVVPSVGHDTRAQATVIDGGKMDGWSAITGCGAPTYNCLTYYTPSQIPNLATLADHFAVSDRTFSLAQSPSWGGHLYAAAASLDGFNGNIPNKAPGVRTGPGWGCDSNRIAKWIDTDGTSSMQPSCIPDQDGSGPFRQSPVPYVPTIFDSLDSTRHSWRVYGAPPPGTVNGQSAGYGWSVCPSFSECLYSKQVRNLVPTADVLSDAHRGRLPSYSILTPSWSSAALYGSAGTGQHNSSSMLVGDNWIGSVVSAIESGPDWNSTAIFITYDDCGCFYDHVPPPTNPDGSVEGPRMPMVIVSPYAIAGSTDSTNATFASILAFTEHVFGLRALAASDASAYDYANSFNFAQAPLPGVRMAVRPVPGSTLAYLRTHPDQGEDDVT